MVREAQASVTCNGMFLLGSVSFIAKRCHAYDNAFAFPRAIQVRMTRSCVTMFYFGRSTLTVKGLDNQRSFRQSSPRGVPSAVRLKGQAVSIGVQSNLPRSPSLQTAGSELEKLELKAIKRGS